MSQPPYDPNQYQQGYAPIGYATPLQPKKPTSVMVLGILAIVFSALGALCMTCGALGPAFQSMMPQSTQQHQPTMSSTANLASIISNVVGIVVSLLGLSAGIGAVMLKRWARSGMIWYALLSILSTLIGAAVNLVFVLPETVEQMTAQQAQQGLPPTAMKAVVYGSTLLFAALAFVLPICILIFFRKRNVVEAFETGGMAQAAYPYQG